MQLGQAVDERSSQAGLACGLPYQRVVVGRVAQAEVRAQIDDAIGERRRTDRCAPWRCRAAGRGTAGRTCSSASRPHELQRASARREVGMREVDELAVEPLARDLPHVEVRMRRAAAAAARRRCSRTRRRWRRIDAIGHRASCYDRRAFGERNRGHVRRRCPPASRWRRSSRPSRPSGRSRPCAPGCSRWSARCCCGTPSCSSLR